MADQPAMIAERPLPEMSPLTEPFWTAARSHQLVIQQCEACGTYRFPPEVGCHACGSTAAAWQPVSGRAVLYSWTVTYPPLLPYFQERVPWPVVIVQLDEGPRLVSNLPDVPVEEYRIGMPLQVDFDDIDDELSLVVFRPA